MQGFEGTFEEYPVLNVGWILSSEPTQREADAMLTVAPDTFRWIVSEQEEPWS